MTEKSETVLLVHTSRSENRSLDMWEDFVSAFPLYRRACQFANISHARCSLVLPKLVLVVLENNEHLKFDCERRLNELLHGWIFRETQFLFVEPEHNWVIPECEKKLEIAAMLPLSTWKSNWKYNLHCYLSSSKKFNFG